MQLSRVNPDHPPIVDVLDATQRSRVQKARRKMFKLSFLNDKPDSGCSASTPCPPLFGDTNISACPLPPFSD